MSKLSRVFQWSLDELRKRRYDIFIASVGYEKRARFIASNLEIIADKRKAIAFSHNQELSYRVNYRWFSSHGFEMNEAPDSEFASLIQEILLTNAGDTSKPMKLCVDISSMSRARMARILAEVGKNSKPIEIDFVYAVANFVPPPTDMAQIESAGPVLDDFAGWSSQPEMPVAAIFGLGYEYHKAVGALDFIEPAEMWAFQAVSSDRRYDEESLVANRFLWADLPGDHRLIYSVTDPFNTFVDLESLVFGVSNEYRPVLIPFGPKIFTLCCLLVALVHNPIVAVWRVTSGPHEVPVDHSADGTVVGLRAVFSPTVQNLRSSSGRHRSLVVPRNAI